MQQAELPVHHLTSRVTRKGQVTIPAAIRRLLSVAPHDKVAFLVEAGHVRLVPALGVTARTAGMLKSDLPRVSLLQEEAAAEEVMAEEAEGRGG